MGFLSANNKKKKSMAPSPNILLLLNNLWQSKWLGLYWCEMHRVQAAVLLGCAKLGLHILVIAYGSVLQVQEEIMLCALCLWSLHCILSGPHVTPRVGFLHHSHSWWVGFPQGAGRKQHWHRRPLILARCGALCPLRGRELPCGAKSFTFPMTCSVLWSICLSLLLTTAISK